MTSRFGKWWHVWLMLAIIWNIAAFTSGWLNLPRAQHLPHDPQLLSKLSNESMSILRGSQVQVKPARSALVWSENPKVVRMWNDTRLTFPATTTSERAAFVASEYRQLLDIEADKQRGPYLLLMLAVWLAPVVLLLVAGLAASTIYRGQQLPPRRTNPDRLAQSRQPQAVAPAFAIGVTGNRASGDTPASGEDLAIRVSLMTPAANDQRIISTCVRQRTEKTPDEDDNHSNESVYANAAARWRAAGVATGSDSQYT